MSTASGGVRDGFECPLWHDAQLRRSLPSKNLLFTSATIFIISRAVFFVSLSSRSFCPCTWQNVHGTPSDEAMYCIVSIS
jgi:hypothetical protein